jgi:hypothetical protein
VNIEELAGTSRLMLRWFCKAAQGQRRSLRAVIIMVTPSSRVVFVQGIWNEAERELSRRLLKETLVQKTISGNKIKKAEDTHTQMNEEHEYQG